MEATQRQVLQATVKQDNPAHFATVRRRVSEGDGFMGYLRLEMVRRGRQGKGGEEMSWLLRRLCEHNAKYLALKTIDYNTELFTSTRVDHEIYCTFCGKTIVPSEHFDNVKDIMRGIKQIEVLKI